MMNHAKEAEKLLRSAQQLPATDKDAAVYPATEDGQDTVAHAIAAAQVHATLAMAQQLEALVLHFAYPQRILGIPEPVEEDKPHGPGWMGVVPTRPQCRATYPPIEGGMQHCTKPLSHIRDGEAHGNSRFRWDLTLNERMGP